ncbi:MAG: M81 family metallopeptidase [Acidobacteria bacterium]|nr:M81 family metallopeptidase [Acidobacteriota bacterium]MCI0722079.1 M81 family metallopeptidase [Acidobacteriota bacterium]
MKKRIAVARLFQETSSFSPRKTTLDDFRQFGLYYGEKVLSLGRELRDEIGGFCNFAEQSGEYELVPVLWAVGWTGGALTSETFDFLKHGLVNGISSTDRLDGVLLALHGSMVAEGIPDTEGDILDSIRRIIGTSVPLVTTFDHHANMTQRIVDSVDGLVAYNQCPHGDVYETGLAGARMMARILRGEILPTIAFQKIPMITPADKFETEKFPLKRWFDMARTMEERSEVVAVAQFPVQPWLDVPEYGWSAVVVTDNEKPLADKLAADIAQAAWDQRREFVVNNPAPDEAVRMAIEEEGPIVIADGADATNGGAPGDSTILLKEMLKQRVDKTTFLTMVDPAAVQAALAVGVGNALTVDLGGKLDPANSSPVRLTGRVTACSDGKFKIVGGSHHAISVDMGRTVVLQAGKIHIVVSEKLNPGHDPLVYRHIGLEPKDAHIIVVKCVVGHMNAYSAIMKKTIWTDCPGATPSNLARLKHRYVQRPLYPLDPEMVWTPKIERATAGTH